MAVSCKKDPGGKGEEGINKIAPDGFSYTTSQKVDLDITLLTNTGEPLKGIPLTVNLPDKPSQEDAIFKAITDENGNIKSTISVASYLDTLIIDPNYVGLLRNAKAVIVNNKIKCTIGGKEGFSGDISESAINPSNKLSLAKKASLNTVSATKPASYIYMGLYDLQGRPLYRELFPDNINAEMLSLINSTLPEQKDQRTLHPNIVSANAASSINLTKESDVYVTFISEGATYSNSIGYYTYPTLDPPTDPSDIEKVYYVLPNASLYGRGGSMRSGDKIKLGTFPAGVSIGFVLFSNGWNNSTKKVNSNAVKYYSNSALNPESSSSLKKHSVLLNYAKENRFIIGFEDSPRDQEECDHDFNDVMLFASANPSTSISTLGVQPLEQAADADGDGINDEDDEFPNDASRAYTNYYPSKNAFATLSFEDNWPATGDYDLNDLVVNYRYAFITNSANKVVEINANYTVKAVGASYRNGFGVQFPFDPSLVSKVTGQKLVNSYIQLNAKGIEEGQSKVVVIPFDNTDALISNYAGAYFVNTKPSMPKVEGDTAHINIKFYSPVSQETIGSAPFNPFLISNMRRGYEIHLPGHPPTDKVDKSLFNTLNDNSNPATGRYYLTKENWPYAINFLESFSYPTEESAIDKTFLHFLDWTKSGGTLFTDWYMNLGSGYRNSENIFNK